MTTIIINILCLVTGFTICSVISWSVHRRHKHAWQKEYRRLMGGIEKAFTDLYTLTSEDVMVMDQPKTADIGLALQKLYQGLE